MSIISVVPRDKKKNEIPETEKVSEGSSRRNIARRHQYDPYKKEKKQHGGGGAGGKGKWNDLDDGSNLMESEE